jgi:hypothetical protein
MQTPPQFPPIIANNLFLNINQSYTETHLVLPFYLGFREIKRVKPNVVQYKTNLIK